MKMGHMVTKRLGTPGLNDQLLHGPDLMNNLVGVLLRFRQYPFVVVGDIVATNQLARAKDSCDERRRCASMRENAYNDFR